jgi:hypothetical protein
MGDQRPSSNHFAGSQPLAAIGRAEQTRRTGGGDIWESCPGIAGRDTTRVKRLLLLYVVLLQWYACYRWPAVGRRRGRTQGEAASLRVTVRRGKGGHGWVVDVQTMQPGFVGLMGLGYCLFP